MVVLAGARGGRSRSPSAVRRPSHRRPRAPARRRRTAPAWLPSPARWLARRRSAIGVRLMYHQTNSAGGGSRNVVVDDHRRYVTKSCLTHQCGDRVGVVHGEHRTHESAKLRADVLDDRPLHHLEDRLDSSRCSVTTTRPDGASTRRISEMAPARLSMNIRAHLARDNVHRSVRDWQRGGVGDVPVDRVRRGDRLRRRRSCPHAMSMPVTAPPAPTRFDASRETRPVPHATSRTRSPGCKSAARSSTRDTGVAMAGTKSR